jgi:hypothetical protein
MTGRMFEMDAPIQLIRALMCEMDPFIHVTDAVMHFTSAFTRVMAAPMQVTDAIVQVTDAVIHFTSAFTRLMAALMQVTDAVVYVADTAVRGIDASIHEVRAPCSLI